MTETLLSPSNVLLFGRVVADLQIKKPVAPPVVPKVDARVRHVHVDKDNPIALDAPPAEIDGVPIKAERRILLTSQPAGENGFYELQVGAVANTLVRINHGLEEGAVIKVNKGDVYGNSYWQLVRDDDERFEKIEDGDSKRHGPFVQPRAEVSGLLEKFLNGDGARFSRIYGFSYEGQYFELARPALFLVHGEGAPATEARTGLKGVRKPSRAPGDPSLTGLAAADFEFADDVRVWSYDKADYTIRMDVETGMFEQVLLDIFFDDGGWGRVSGAKVSGAKVSGAKVSGAKVSGAKLSGMRFRGDPTD